MARTEADAVAHEDAAMLKLTDVSHHAIHAHSEHCINQIATRLVTSGEIVAVFNEERFPYHHDSGQTLLKRSPDGGRSWLESSLAVVLPWTATTGNLDCGFCGLADGARPLHLTLPRPFTPLTPPHPPPR